MLKVNKRRQILGHICLKKSVNGLGNILLLQKLSFPQEIQNDLEADKHSG